MSKGYGEVQRHVLARLAENTADPAADLDAPPYHQSWTSLRDLRAGTPYHDESVLRAVSKLAAAGIVETRLLQPIRWRMTDDPDAPGAVTRPRWETGVFAKLFARFAWQRPVRDHGNKQLHARMVCR